ncbi:tyrosine-type recombinase/integrase [Tengunoibacter tsumagoiensis]|uniref:Tyr recombinase domain-containing protein n=1 Tax=Tengunoibacter tsumagoiensis TaxID=2014871 RepID=A0A402A7I1_9CHLR|nr:tyrosine-type recombinase/integrase [Tengunoibacter tsumagoiensis]GCE15092.1 hypothetical protein KTT_49510 [Tengunoibacter tsumagoiensis]
MGDQNLLETNSRNTIDIVIGLWLDTKTHLSGSKKTYQAYKDTLTSFREFLWQGGRDLNPQSNTNGDESAQAYQHAIMEITLAAQIFAGISARNRAISETTYNQRLAIISSFYNFANKRHFFTCGNPINSVERAKVQPYKNVQPLEPLEVARLIKAIDRTTGKGARDYAMIAIFFQTGRRLSEVIALRWHNINLQGKDRKITITFEKCKGGKTMRDTIPTTVSQALLEWMGVAYGKLENIPADAPLWISFTRQSAKTEYNSKDVLAPLTIRSVANIFKQRLGVSKVHIARHTYARTMEDAGAKVSEIQARLGHESLATTGRYLAALTQADNKYSDTLASLFGLE